MKTLKSYFSFSLLILFVSVLFAANGMAQDKKIVMEVESLTLQIGEETKLSAKVTDMQGAQLPDTVVFFSSSRRNLAVTQQGDVKALKPGSFSQ